MLENEIILPLDYREDEVVARACASGFSSRW
jgi:hypothetical protein